MPSPRRSRFTIRADFSGDDRGVSETIGNVLLIVMAVTMLGAFGTLVISSVSSDTPTPPAATFTMAPRAGEAFALVRHVSGSALDLASTHILLQSNATDVLGTLTLVDGTGADAWAPGETLRIDLTGGALRPTARLFLMVIDEASGKSVGSAWATVPSDQAGTTILHNALTATLTFDRTQLTVDARTFVNATVRVSSDLGILLIDRALLDLSTVGGDAAIPMYDNGVSPDLVGNDGEFTARFAVDNLTFTSLPGYANRTITAEIHDVIGRNATASANLFLTSAPVSKVGTGTEFRNIGSSGIISTAGYLNLTGFTFRDATKVDKDQIEVRVSDLSDPSVAWSALVTFDDAEVDGDGACPAPSVTSVVLRRDGVAGNVTYVPSGGCFPVDVDSRVNLANIHMSLDASLATSTWTPTGAESTFQYAAAGIGTSNEALIAYFGDITTTAPLATGLGQADLTWAPPIAVANPPSAITTLAGTSGDRYVDLAWTAPSNGGSAITGYQIWRDGVLIDTIGTNTTYRAGGLTNGVQYAFLVRAVNAAGTSASSNNVLATPAALPSVPLLFSAEPAIGRAYLNWSAPAANGGFPITAYRIYLNGTLSDTIGTNTSYVAMGREHNSTYNWQVSAITAQGEGPKTTSTPSTTPGIPYPPLNYLASAGNALVTLSWGAPNANGRDITAYQIFRNGTLIDTIGTNLSYTVTNLVNGVSYALGVKAVNEVGASMAVSASVTPATLAGAPLTLTAQPTAARVYLNWSAPSDNGGSAITGYKIFRNGTLLDTIGTNVTYVALGLEHNTTYAWEIAAINANGDGTHTTSTPATTPGVPYPPASFSATAGNTIASLSWSLPSSNGGRAISAYKIYVNGALRDTIGTNTSYVVNGLTNGVAYTVAVSAVNDVGEGDRATTGVTPTLGAVAPGAPTGFALAASNATISLNWTAPNDGGSHITAYKIYRNGTLIDTIGTNVTYVAGGLINGVTYTFEVSAVNAAGEGARTSAAALAPGTIPNPPVLTLATAGNRTVALTWTAPTVDGGRPISGFNVYNASSGGLIATTANGANTSFTVNGLANGTLYSFRITALNALGGSAVSNTLTATPIGGSFPPTGLSATSVGNRTVTLGWTAPSNNGGASVTNYQLYNASSGALIGSTGGANTTFAANSLTNGTAYQFYVLAVNAGGASSGSNIATATPIGAPFPPTALAASSSNASIALSWTLPIYDSGSGFTGFRIVNASNGATVATTTNGANTSFTVNGLANGLAYTHYVVALNAAGASSGTALASATPAGVPYPPGSFAAVTSALAQVNLSWSAPPSNGGSAITNYHIYRNGTLVATLGAANTTFVDLNVVSGVTYNYTIRAQNAIGMSSTPYTLSRTVGGALTALNCAQVTQVSGNPLDCTSLTLADGAYSDIDEGGGSPKTFEAKINASVAGITGTTHTLQIYGYMSAAQAEDLRVQAWNYTTSAWDTIATLPATATSAPGTLATGQLAPAHHFVGNLLQVRIVDTSNDTSRTHWFVDYVRMVST